MRIYDNNVTGLADVDCLDGAVLTATAVPTMRIPSKRSFILKVIALNRPMQTEMAYVMEPYESRPLKPCTTSEGGLSMDSLIDKSRNYTSNRDWCFPLPFGKN
jgi:hypothetical protein